jgi:23S rRNA pseudouridine1911/1915/1917 synthase
MNRGHVYEETLDGSCAGRTALGHLCATYRHTDPDEWLARIGAGDVRLEGQPVGADTPLVPGQRLTWHRPPWQEPDAPCTFDVIFEDEHVLAVNKPAGLPTLPGGGFLDHTLLALVQGRDTSATPLHRLGRWTSGIVVFARTDLARRALSAAWRQHDVTKTYRARATGEPVADRFSIDAPIGKIPYAALGTLHAASASGKASLTLVEVVERRGDEFLAHVRPVTGRPHQIRIHLAAAGHPLAGDPLYGVGGVPRFGTTALPGDPGYDLHAWRVGFVHPGTGERIELLAE